LNSPHALRSAISLSSIQFEWVLSVKDRLAPSQWVCIRVGTHASGVLIAVDTARRRRAYPGHFLLE
jgi:hypothetical protein